MCDCCVCKVRKPLPSVSGHLNLQRARLFPIHGENSLETLDPEQIFISVRVVL